MAALMYLVGYSSDRSGTDALALGRMLASKSGHPLTVCAVIPETWGYPSPARVDAEYGAFLQAHAQKGLDAARIALGDATDVSFLLRSAQSASTGLAVAANDISAELIILGSARDGPNLRNSLGSVASGVLALTDRPVILTPRGFARGRVPVCSRITCAFADVREDDRTLRTAVALCQRHGLPLRLATFVVRDKQMYPSRIGYDIESIVSNGWRRQATKAQEKVLAELPPDVEAKAVIGDGSDWRHAVAAIEWLDGEILVAGSRHMGTVSGFLFGTAFTRLLRYAEVPIVAVP